MKAEKLLIFFHASRKVINIFSALSAIYAGFIPFLYVMLLF